VHGEACESLADERWLARVKTHAHARLGAGRPGVALQGTLPLDGSRDRIEGAPEDDEEGIAL
jgi:hypothetical protein